MTLELNLIKSYAMLLIYSNKKLMILNTYNTSIMSLPEPGHWTWI